ncbi:hypothetical protein Tco_0370820 [Tanacetum coccineum]
MASLPKCWALQERVGGWEWEMVVAYDEKVHFIRELEYVPGVIAVVKMTKFLNEKLWKDDRRLQKLRNIEMPAEEIAFDKDPIKAKASSISEKFLVFTVGECKGFASKAQRRESKHYLGDELWRAINSPDWEPMFILYCRHSITEDLRLAREINALCAGLTAIIDERENFVDELNVLVGRSVPDKMAEFIKEVQSKDIPNLMKLQILGREFKLRAQEKDLFIEKLKGNMDF